MRNGIWRRGSFYRMVLICCRMSPDTVHTVFGPFFLLYGKLCRFIWKTLSISHMSKLRFRLKIFPIFTKPVINRFVTNSCNISYVHSSFSPYHFETNSSIFTRDSIRAFRPFSLFLPRSPLKNFVLRSSIGTNRWLPYS